MSIHFESYYPSRFILFHVPNVHFWGNFKSKWGSFSNNMSLFYVILHMFLFSSACFPFCPCYLWLVAGVIRMNSNFITDKKNSIEIISCNSMKKAEFRKKKKRDYFCLSHIEVTWSPSPLPQGCWAVFEKRCWFDIFIDHFLLLMGI